MKKLLVWEQHHRLPVFWNTKLSDAFMFIKSLRDRKRPNWPYPLQLAGDNGWGKTTVLNELSLNTDLVCIDGDPFGVAYHAFLTEADPNLTVGEYSKKVDYWLNKLSKTLPKDEVRSLLEHADVLTGMAPSSATPILLLPQYDMYRKALYTRDWDPTVKRNHKGKTVKSYAEYREFVLWWQADLSWKEDKFILPHAYERGLWKSVLEVVHFYTTKAMPQNWQER